MSLHVVLPAVLAQISENTFFGLRCRVPAVIASMSEFPPTPTPIPRLYREPIITGLAAEEAVPATAGYWQWQRHGPLVGPISLDSDEIDQNKIRIIKGRRVSDAYTVIYGGDDGVRVFTKIMYADVTWEERTWVAPQPAVPAREASTVVTGSFGWDGGGRGRNQTPVGWRVIYRLMRFAGVQAGLARPGGFYSFATPLFSWYFERVSMHCVIAGAVVATLPETVDNSIVKNWRFGIHRRSGRINWIYATNHDEPFTVFHSAVDPGGPMVPIGMPYMSGDMVDLLEVSQYHMLEQTLPGLQSFMQSSMSSVSGYARIRARLPRISSKLVLLETNDLALTLPGAQARLGDALWGQISLRTPPVDASLRSEPTFDINMLYARIPAVTTTIAGYTPIEANLDSTLPAVLVRLEDNMRGHITGTLPPLSARLSDYERDFGMDILTLGFSHNLSSPLTLITAEGLEVGDATDIIVIFDLLTAEGINLRSLSGLGDLVEILVEEGVYISAAGNDLARREALQYAVNIATGAPSVYEGFDFNGFVNVDDIAYGWKADGLYRIGESNEADDTAAIRALVDFGISDYGGAQRKRAAAAWLGVRTDGQTYLKVRADNGAEHVYRAVASRDNHKAILAKGVAGRRWSFTLEIEDASFASLDSLEIEIAVTARRFGGD